MPGFRDFMNNQDFWAGAGPALGQSSVNYPYSNPILDAIMGGRHSMALAQERREEEVQRQREERRQEDDRNRKLMIQRASLGSQLGASVAAPIFGIEDIESDPILGPISAMKTAQEMAEKDRMAQELAQLRAVFGEDSEALGVAGLLDGAQQDIFLRDHYKRQNAPPPKREFRTVGGSLLDVSGDDPKVIYRSPDKPSPPPKAPVPISDYQRESLDLRRAALRAGIAKTVAGNVMIPDDEKAEMIEQMVDFALAAGGGGTGNIGAEGSKDALLNQVISSAAEAGKALTREKIEKAAQRAGISYQEALKSFASELGVI